MKYSITQWLGKEIEIDANRELNFLNEAKNCIKAGILFKDDSTISIPKVYTGLSTGKVMTMSFMNGIPITHVKEMKEKGLNLKDVAQAITHIYCKQIFQFGFVHSDPHPGNILIEPVMKNGKTVPKVVLLDHGLYEELDTRTRALYSMLWLSIIKQDKEGIKMCIKGLGAPMPKLFVSMLMNRRYEEVMDKSEKYKIKSRLGNPSSDNQKTEVRFLAEQYYKEITILLGTVQRDQLLLFKVTEFLRGIEHKIGNPTNTYISFYEYAKNTVRKLERNKTCMSKISSAIDDLEMDIGLDLLKVYSSAMYWMFPSKEVLRDVENFK